MIDIQKHQDVTSNSIIRSATAGELTNYEKNKLAKIEEQAQQNKIEAIRLNGARVAVDKDTKTADIRVGNLAFKNTVTSGDLDSGELFFIRCSLD